MNMKHYYYSVTSLLDYFLKNSINVFLFSSIDGAIFIEIIVFKKLQILSFFLIIIKTIFILNNNDNELNLIKI